MDTSSTTTAAAAAATAERAGRSTGKQLMGLPVISLADGEQLGGVHDVVYNPEAGRLVGFTVTRGGGVFSSGETFWLAADQIHAIGEDAVTIDAATLLQPYAGTTSEFEEQAGVAVLGKRLLTEGGKFLGNVDDVLIDRHSRRVVAYEVSGGLWSDMMRGQTDVPVDHILAIGKDVVVVPDSVAAQVEAPSGGLIAAAETARERVAEATETVKEKAALARTEAAVAIENKEADYARGRVAGRDVLDDAGNVIVPADATITDAHIQRAIAAGKMHALAAAAGYGHASETAETVRERATAAGAAVRERAEDLSEAAQDRQAEMLVGRRTGRAVVLENGAVLVPAEHVLTAADVAAARTAGKLGDLTGAVAQDAVEGARDSAGNAFDRFRERVAPAAAAAPAFPETPVVVIEQPQNVVVESAGTVVAPGVATPVHPDDTLVLDAETDAEEGTASPAAPPATPAQRTTTF